MVDMSADMHVQQQNGTNHKETSCGMDRTVSKLYRIVLWSVIHILYVNSWVFSLFAQAGFYQSLDRLCCLITSLWLL